MRHVIGNPCDTESHRPDPPDRRSLVIRGNAAGLPMGSKKPSRIVLHGFRLMGAPHFLCRDAVEAGDLLAAEVEGPNFSGRRLGVDKGKANGEHFQRNAGFTRNNPKPDKLGRWQHRLVPHVRRDLARDFQQGHVVAAANILSRDGCCHRRVVS
jgi:hypothetical protein